MTHCAITRRSGRSRGDSGPVTNEAQFGLHCQGGCLRSGIDWTPCVVRSCGWWNGCLQGCKVESQFVAGLSVAAEGLSRACQCASGNASADQSVRVRRSVFPLQSLGEIVDRLVAHAEPLARAVAC